MVLSLCVRSVPAAAGPVLPNGPAGLPDAIKRELQRLQHVSKQTHFSRSVKQLLLQQMTLHVRLSLFTLAEVVKVLMTPFCFQTVWSDDSWAGLSGWGVFTAEERSHAQQSSRWRTAGTYCAVYCNFKGTYWIFFVLLLKSWTLSTIVILTPLTSGYDFLCNYLFIVNYEARLNTDFKMFSLLWKGC